MLHGILWFISNFPLSLLGHESINQKTTSLAFCGCLTCYVILLIWESYLLLLTVLLSQSLLELSNILAILRQRLEETLGQILIIANWLKWLMAMLNYVLARFQCSCMLQLQRTCHRLGGIMSVLDYQIALNISIEALMNQLEAAWIFRDRLNMLNRPDSRQDVFFT